MRGREALGEPLSDPGDRNRFAYFIPPEKLHRMPLDGHREPKITPAKGKLVRVEERYEYQEGNVS
jgi:hypothetical protein